MKTKTLIVSGIGVLVALAVIGYKKVADLQAIFDKMTIDPAGIRNIKLSWSTVSFNLDVKLTNTTSQAFTVTGIPATFRRMYISYRGTFLGAAEVHLDAINIPAFSSVILKDLPVVVDTKAIISQLGNLQNISTNDLTVAAVIAVAGKEFTIER